MPHPLTAQPRPMTVPPGTALRLLLLAWSLDDPGVSATEYAWLADRLLERGARLKPSEYQEVAYWFETWGERQGISEVMTRAIEDAAVLATTPQEARERHV